MTEKAKKPKAPRAPKKLKSEDLSNKMESPTVFDVHKIYKVEAVPGAKHLIEGRIYEVTGELARELIKKGVAKLI
jgi:hypothetical protein